MYFTLETLDKKIDNVSEVLGWCKYYRSEWGISYWESVLNALNRERKRLILMEKT